MKKAIYLLLLFVPTFLFAQHHHDHSGHDHSGHNHDHSGHNHNHSHGNTNPQAGIVADTVYEKSDDGITIMEVHYQSGITKATGPLKDKVKNGRWFGYHPSGVLNSIIEYQAGLRHGLSVVLDSRGGIISQENYSEGKKNGSSRIYADVRGAKVLKTHTVYKDDLLHGKKVQYTENGKLQAIAEYQNGEKHGKSSWYYSNGNPAIEQNYSKDVLNGSQISYYEDGQVRSEANYVDGKLHGFWTEFHPNGELKVKGTYEHGEKTGKWTYYTEDKKVEKTEKF